MLLRDKVMKPSDEVELEVISDAPYLRTRTWYVMPEWKMPKKAEPKIPKKDEPNTEVPDEDEGSS